ncbi:Ger(x)C family spore germination protein [Neobacillus cucumis]|uniref:Ger(x)C family spore germination protein n=1 Tax=Neobacillus cucumis TaxID=1740721 RepID=UPI0018E01510|nr:Ger(x)C family spore germination protein [Neobacillus cucumis]MBI0577743.1 Ger(x)C family spore germination protein [Neobacillus cucumis]
MRQQIKRWLVILMSLIMLLPLGGCWDTFEPERMVYAYGMAVDYKKGQYIAYLQMINLGLLAKTEVSGGNSEENVEVGRATGKTVDQAIFNLYGSAQRRIFWGHLSYLILTEEALKSDGIKSVVDLLDRYRETRYRIWFYATKDSLSEILLNTPILGMSSALSRISDPKATFQQNSFIQPINMREVLISIDEPVHEASLPVITITKENWMTQKKPHESLKIEGIAVVKRNRLKGFVMGSQANGLRWMNKKMKRSNLTVKDNPKNIDVLVTNLKVKVKPVIRNKNIQFDVKVKADSVIDHVEQNFNRITLATKIEEKIKKEIMETYLYGLSIDADLYRLTEVLYRKNVRVWKMVQHQGKVPLKKDSLRNIQVKIDVIHGEKQRDKPTL